MLYFSFKYMTNFAYEHRNIKISLNIRNYLKSIIIITWYLSLLQMRYFCLICIQMNTLENLKNK